MSEDLGILFTLLIIHWVLVFIPVWKNAKWRSAILNLSIQALYATYFIYGICAGDPSSSLGYYFYLIFFVAIHALVNANQLAILSFRK